jgi:hypothetical protein
MARYCRAKNPHDPRVTPEDENGSAIGAIFIPKCNSPEKNDEAQVLKREIANHYALLGVSLLIYARLSK